ncbi:MAG: radical SAM protein [Desulfocapsaceae bacterium]|nr:radical SAM protein [Desulfocapsaceae bacterium]
MKNTSKKQPPYAGFEQGPTRPPSEAASLLIRITRNCPWNRCIFCQIHRDNTFSLRPVDHVLMDIDTIHRHVGLIRKVIGGPGKITRDHILALTAWTEPDELKVLNAALHWARDGMRTIFLQDANSLIIKPRDLISILTHLRKRFPWVERITSYASSHTLARIDDRDLNQIAAAGLNRIHIGMESGSNKVLAMVNKGVDREVHVQAGLKVKRAGMELSVYVMPGLGGKALSHSHAAETADMLNRINPDFIRLSTLAMPTHPWNLKQLGRENFVRQNDREIALELLFLLEDLKGITSTVHSNHMLNLFEDMEGTFPQDQEKMIAIAQEFLGMPVDEQVLYQVGRRIGFFTGLRDLQDPIKRARAEKTCSYHGIGPDNVDAAISKMMKNFFKLETAATAIPTLIPAL